MGDDTSRRKCAAGFETGFKKMTAKEQKRRATSLGALLKAAVVGSPARGLRVRGIKGTRDMSSARGTRGLGTHGIEATGTLLAGDLQKISRLPKPRSTVWINEEKWLTSQQCALNEVRVEFKIPVDPDMYYNTMCMVGKRALVAAIHSKTQAIYDSTMANFVKRMNRKNKP